MVERYIQSVEQYKGWTLELELFILDATTRRYHRKCNVSNETASFTFKTKKEAKEFIDAGMLDIQY